MKSFREIAKSSINEGIDSEELILSIIEISKAGKLRDVKSKDFNAWAKELRIQKEVKGMNQKEMYHYFSAKVTNDFIPRLKK